MLHVELYHEACDTSLHLIGHVGILHRKYERNPLLSVLYHTIWNISCISLIWFSRDSHMNIAMFSTGTFKPTGRGLSAELEIFMKFYQIFSVGSHHFSVRISPQPHLWILPGLNHDQTVFLPDPSINVTELVDIHPPKTPHTPQGCIQGFAPVLHPYMNTREIACGYYGYLPIPNAHPS